MAAYARTALAVAFAVACAGAACARHAVVPGSASGARCTTHLAAGDPRLASPPDPPARPSRIVLEWRAPLDRLKRRLEENVPVTLAASDRQPIGAAGTARYRVRRGAFSIAMSGDSLVVATPIHIHIEVSKSFGPLNVDYGRCDPELVSTVTVPLRVTSDFEPPNAVVTTRMTRGCTIAVMDASGEIQNEATRQTRAFEHQLKTELAGLPRAVRQAFVPVSIPLGKQGSVRFRPSEFDYEPPRIDEDTLHGRVAVIGETEWIATAGPAPESSGPAATPKAREVEHIEPESALVVQSGWPWSELEASLATRAKAMPARADSRLIGVAARSTAIDGKPCVALRLDLDGQTCGSAWVASSAVYDPVARRVVFGDATPLGDPSGSDSAKLLRDWSTALSVPLPSAFEQRLAALRADLDGLGDSLLTLTKGQAYFKAKLAPFTSVLVAVDPVERELRLSFELRTRIVAELE